MRRRYSFSHCLPDITTDAVNSDVRRLAYERSEVVTISVGELFHTGEAAECSLGRQISQGRGKSLGGALPTVRWDPGRILPGGRWQRQSRREIIDQQEPVVSRLSFVNGTEAEVRVFILDPPGPLYAFRCESSNLLIAIDHSPIVHHRGSILSDVLVPGLTEKWKDPWME